MRVLKFGGTSVGSPEAVRRAADLVEAECRSGGLVVVSALSGTTDTLLGAVEAAARGSLPEAQQIQRTIRERHDAVAEALALAPPWEPIFQRLGALLEGMGLLWEATPRARDAALAVGETLAAQLLAALLAARGSPAPFRDVREVLKTDDRHGRARVDLEATRQACAPWRRELRQGGLIVTQGFIGGAPDGATTTLGRGGSDTSATLLGEALGAEEVQIWTDVDGILTADPSLVGQARPIPCMSLREAAALSAFGAKVLHADALAPVARAGFRLVVANTRRPAASRTTIARDAAPGHPGPITSVAYKEGLVCVRLPAGEDLERLTRAALALQEAGSSRFGLLATPEGGLLLVRPETQAAWAHLADLAASGLACEPGWAVVALVGEGLQEGRGAALGLLSALRTEPVAGLLAGDTGVSLAFLVPEGRLPTLIPHLHRHCIELPLTEPTHEPVP